MTTNRYIVLLKDQDEKSIENVEKEFSVSVTSSELLSKDNRSFDIIDNNNAVLYKNLGVMVVDDIDEKQLAASLVDKKSPVVYYEKEREFFTADETSLFNNLKTSVELLKEKILELEKFLKNREKWLKKLIKLANFSVARLQRPHF